MQVYLPSTPRIAAHTTRKYLSIKSLRAENETRTRDPNLGKVMLYQLSYFRRSFL